MACEMCGNNDSSVSAEIEGVVLRVCSQCAQFGKVLQKSSQRFASQRHIQQKAPVPEIIETVMDDYAVKIKQAREKRSMNQEEFARFLNERESTMQKIETGKQKPYIALAKKLEKFLTIKLVEEITMEQTENSPAKKATGSLTIGDLLQRR